MPFRERAARAGFQVPLELCSPFLIRELHDGDEFPRTSGRCMRRQTRVVGRNSGVNVRRESGVIAGWNALALKDVNEAILA